MVNFDLRKTPTNYEKRKARELYNKFLPVIQNPSDYNVRVVKKETANKIDCQKVKAATKAGNVKLWIPKQGMEGLRIKKDGKVIRGKITDGLQMTTFKGGKDIFKTAEKLFKKMPKSNDMYKSYIMVTIGGNAPFQRVFKSMADFEFYMRNWEPKDSSEDDEEEREDHRAYLFRHMNVVLVKNPHGYFEGQPNAEKKKSRKKNRSNRF